MTVVSINQFPPLNAHQDPILRLNRSEDQSRHRHLMTPSTLGWQFVIHCRSAAMSVTKWIFMTTLRTCNLKASRNLIFPLISWSRPSVINNLFEHEPVTPEASGPIWYAQSESYGCNHPLMTVDDILFVHDNYWHEGDEDNINNISTLGPSSYLYNQFGPGDCQINCL